LTNATCCPSAFAFARASSSNTGSIILHGGHVADVNIATTARCAPSRLRNDAGFVDGWMAVVVVWLLLLPRALVEGAGEGVRVLGLLWRERGWCGGGSGRRGWLLGYWWGRIATEYDIYARMQCCAERRREEVSGWI
jgi:hypothetical protein